MTITLRPALPEDIDALERLHALSMRPHVEKIYQWDDSLFRRTFDPTLVRVIVVDGCDVGMLSVSEEHGAVLLRQISIAPDYGNRGIGTRIIRMVIDDAERRSMPVRLRVLRQNPAKQLYERLGFREIEATETHHILQRKTFYGEKVMTTIRPIRPDEAEVAKEVIRTVWRRIFDEVILTEDVTDFVLNYFNDPTTLRDMDDIPTFYGTGGTFLVIADGDRVVGTGGVGRMDDDICELRRVFLLQEYQGTGLGAAIMRELLDFARDAGYQKMRLSSNNKLYAAHRLYYHLGFYDIEPYEEGIEKYAYTMEKDLGGDEWTLQTSPHTLL
ncbi:MAG: GNAT family N-acetyltransferase [Bacteroidota bacterium]